jgi:hypothetical protein
MKKSQVAVEYIVMVVVVLSILVPSMYFVYQRQKEPQTETSLQKMFEIGETIKQAAEQLYSTPGLNKKTIEFNFPSGMQEIKIENSRQIVITADTDEGTKVLTFESNVPISATITKDDFRKGKIVLERQDLGDQIVVVLSTTGKVNCSAAEVPGLTCDNGLDDDCDAKVDLFDSDCCDDLDNDTYTDIACGGNDCDDTDSKVHPWHTELCDGIDNNCNGIIDTDGPCIVNGDGNCDVGEAFAADCPKEIHCFDGVDNDQDHMTDWLDCDDCITSSTCGDSTCQIGEICGQNATCPGGDCDKEYHCFDNVDNDQNGLKDMADPYCTSISGCPSGTGQCFTGSECRIDCPTEDAGIGTCNDMVDNDEDGLVDAWDPDCPAVCGDGYCNRWEKCSQDCDIEYYCDDGIDNDDDGKTDGFPNPDLDCAQLNTELPAVSCAVFNNDTGCIGKYTFRLFTFHNTTLAADEYGISNSTYYSNNLRGEWHVCCNITGSVTDRNASVQVYEKIGSCADGGILRFSDYEGGFIEPYDYLNTTERSFIRGDVHQDGIINQTDVDILQEYFIKGKKVPCMDALDINNDEIVSTADISMLQSFVNTGNPPIPPPGFPGGLDNTSAADALHCYSQAEAKFMRGDLDRNGVISIISDSPMISLYDEIFSRNYNINDYPCIDRLDIDDNGKIDRDDRDMLHDFLFLGAPVPPNNVFSEGFDPTQDTLPCRLQQGTVHRKFIRGDLNLDGSIDILDATYLNSYLSGSQELLCEDAADLDNDEDIDSDDYSILNTYAGTGIWPRTVPYPNISHGIGYDYDNITMPGIDNLGCPISPYSLCADMSIGKIRCEPKKGGCPAGSECVVKLDQEDSIARPSVYNATIGNCSDSLPYSMCCSIEPRCGDGACTKGEKCALDCKNETHCTDSVDNDEDGATDTDIESCGFCGDGVCNYGEVACFAGPPPLDDCAAETGPGCLDTIDNDNDGCIDSQDSDCGGIEVCGDAMNTDCDAFTTDCPWDGSGGAVATGDPDCDETAFSKELTCLDGCDNDNDGLTDGADPDCVGSAFFTCTPRDTTGTSCSALAPDEVCVIKFANSTYGNYNAHADSCNSTDYNWSICCKAMIAGVNPIPMSLTIRDNICSQGKLVSILGESGGMDNAHLSIYNDIGTPYDLCLSSLHENYTITCLYRDNCLGNEECAFRFQNEAGGMRNSHVARCSSDYENAVCCKVNKIA